MIKKIFLDTETTSPNRFRCGLWQIGGIIEVGKRQEEFCFECDIFSEDQIDDKAMQMNGLTLEILAQKPDPGEVIIKFQDLLGRYVDKFDKRDKLYFINYGAEFDSEVLRQWWAKNGDDYYGSWFWHPPIDIMVLAMQSLMCMGNGGRSDVKNFKLQTVLDYYGIGYDANILHTAVYDAQKARELYYCIGKEGLSF